MNTILIFYFQTEHRIRIIYKQGNDEKGMEEFTDVYLTPAANGQIHIMKHNPQMENYPNGIKPLMSIPVSRTIIKYQ